MLPKEHRLKRESEIKTLLKKGRSVFGMYLRLKYLKNDLEISRFAIVAGLKISKKAVVRNRLKRQVRAIIQEHLDRIAEGFDIMVMLKKEAIGKTSKDLEEDLLKSFKKAKLLS